MKSSRGFVWLSLLPYLIGGIAVASFAGWVWWQAQHWCNAVCREQTERAASAEALVAAAQKRATDLALMWAEAIHRVEVKYVEVVKWRTRTFVEIRERPYHAEGSITLAPDARGVLADSARAANDPGPADGNSPATEAVPEAAGGVTTTSSAAEWVEFAVNAAEAYADAREKWMACVAWADSIKTGAASADTAAAPVHSGKQ